MTLELPFPPSMNHYWRSTPKGVLISSAGRKYRVDVLASILSKHGRPKTLTDRLRVTIEAYPPDRRKRDLSNIPKALEDALTHAGVWEDDSLIDHLEIIRREVCAGGRVVVTIDVHETV